MRSIEELIDNNDPGWNFVKEWIDSANNKVEILPVDNSKAEDALLKIQVTTRSPMGAIVYMTGGLLIDNGWIRILGSGSPQMKRTLPDWNLNKAFKEFGQPAPYLLIADDVIGGFFLLNGGGLGEDLGKIYYFAPDSLSYEALDVTYTEFLNFCLNNNLDEFYEGYRWPNWHEEVSKLSCDKVFNFVPPIWTVEGKDFNTHSRRGIPVDEQYSLNLEFRKQLGMEG